MAMSQSTRRKSAESVETGLVIFQKKVVGLKQESLERFLLRARRAARLRKPVTVLVTSSSAVQSLNRRFLGKNKATDVLSFPAPPS
jgi:ssRNA-specific RNase YbeY (16S rRNA maturation enzyme)